MEIIIVLLIIVCYIAIGILTYGVLYGVLYEIDRMYINSSEPSSNKVRFVPLSLSLFGIIGLLVAIISALIFSNIYNFPISIKYTNKDLREKWERIHYGNKEDA